MQTVPPIASPRLDLVPMTPDFLRATLAGDRAGAEVLLGLAIPPEWFVEPGFKQHFLRELERDAALQPWLMRAIGLRSERTMVGHVGFHTAPNAPYLSEFVPDGVEFGYTVFAAHRRRGYAREASDALMRWAHREHGVTRFVVSIRPDNTPSRALAAQIGFVRIGEHIDEIDGLEDIYELPMERYLAERR